LDALAQRGAAGLKGAVLLNAEYVYDDDGLEGDVTGDVKAKFFATYQVYCFSDEAFDLTVPLGGVELQAATLDGAQAFPVALRPPQTGYSFRLEKSKGLTRTLRLNFTVRPTIAGSERELKWTIPEVVQSRLRLSVPEGARYLHAVV